jgi:two-component system, LytTR family, sensor kinase
MSTPSVRIPGPSRFRAWSWIEATTSGYWILGSLACAVLTCLGAAQVYLYQLINNQHPLWLESLSWAAAEWCSWFLLVPGVAKIAPRFPLYRRQRIVRNVSINLLLASLSAITCIALQSEVNQIIYHGEYGFGPGLSKPFLRLVSQKIAWVYLGYWVVIAFANARMSSREFDRESRIRGELEEETRLSQLRILQSQMRPHFLFNCLNALVSMLPERSAAQAFTIRLSDLIRETLLFGDRPLSTLSEELEFAKCYVDIERTRFGDRLSVRFSVEDGLENFLLPTHIIQPLLENAVNYGVSLTKEAYPIDVAAVRSDAGIVISVKNACLPTAPVTWRHNGITHGNSRRRLQLLYADAASLTCGRAGGIYECRLEVPNMQAPGRDG